MDNNVTHPSHYTRGDIECIDAIRASMSNEEYAAFCKGNVIKYLWRWDKKGGAEDLEKAREYLGWLIDAARKAEQEAAEMLREWLERQKAKEAETT